MAKYSTLEVVRLGSQSGNFQPAVSSDPGKQLFVDYATNQQTIYTAVEEGREVTDSPNYKDFHGNGNSGNGADGLVDDSLPGPYRRKWSTRRKLVIIGGPIALVVILAAVLGGVLGSVLKPAAGSSSTSSSSFSPSSNSNSTTTTSSAGLATPTPNVHDISAISFLQNDINHTRIFYQDNTGQLIQTSNEATTAQWNNDPLGFYPKNNSALAVAVSTPSFKDFLISIFYTDADYLLHDMIFNATVNAWAAGSLSVENYKLLPNSSIAGLYNQCLLCANTTIIAFQDQSGALQVKNYTSAGWVNSSLVLTTNILVGTGLSMHPIYLPSAPDQIDIMYQTSTFNISTAAWKPALYNNGVFGWDSTEETFAAIPPGNSIASASSFSSVTNGRPTWIELLSPSSTGLKVDTWSGTTEEWISQNSYPSIMSISSTNPVTYGSVSLTATGGAYAVARVGGKDTITSWQVEDDTVTWTSTGNVEIGTAWG